MLLNEDIVYIAKPDGICLLTFIADEFSGLSLHPSIFSIILQDLRNNEWCFIKFFDID